MPTSKGFTLVETLVAIAILMIAIVGPFYSIQQAITSSYTSRDQLIATSLAQEGAEYIYFVRDNNFLTPGNTWTQGMDNCMVAAHPNGCTVDPTLIANALQPCNSACPVLNLNSSSQYTQGAGAPSRFTRTLKIAPVPGHPEAILVTSQVTWTTNHQVFTTAATENLYNWL
ncbi:MAG: prepilin-type N-terminal cleavage/methylation domain-containing protein [Candidatus Paceibacterota bacterium]